MIQLWVGMTEDTQEFFFEWDKKNDYSSRGSEELLEAALAALHYPRDKITYPQLVEEMADAIISATHVCWSVGMNIDDLNEAIQRKLQKGQTQI